MIWMISAGVLVMIVALLTMGVRKRSRRHRGGSGGHGWMSQSWLAEHRQSHSS